MLYLPSPHPTPRCVQMGGQSSRGEHSYGIDVLCKDMRTLRFSHRQVNHTRRHIFEALLSHAFPSSAGKIAAH